jgi:hypothetical protein
VTRVVGVFVRFRAPLQSNQLYVFNRSRNQLKTERFSGVNQEINKRNFYLKNNTSYRFANDAGIEGFD